MDAISSYDVSTGKLIITLPTTGSFTFDDLSAIFLQVSYINSETTPNFQDRNVVAYAEDSSGAKSNEVAITIQMLDSYGNYQGGGGSVPKPLSPSIISATAIAATELVNEVEGKFLVLVFNNCWPTVI